MTHDDLVAVLLLLGVSPVDVATERCLNASSIFMVLLEDGREVESHLCHMTGFCLSPSQYMMLQYIVGNVGSVSSQNEANYLEKSHAYYRLYQD